MDESLNVKNPAGAPSALNVGLGLISKLREWEEWHRCQEECELADMTGKAANKIERLQKVLQQVLTDAKAQDVLPEWWTVMQQTLDA